MSRVLVDSTVLIDALRGRAAAERLRSARRRGDEPWVCAVSVEEIWCGLLAHEQPVARRLFRGLRCAPLGVAEGERARSWRRRFSERRVTPPHAARPLAGGASPSIQVVTVLDQLGAAELRATVHAYKEALAAHREPINRLNVYPVPDGDTGTNMSLTLVSVCDDLDAAGEGLDEVCQAISHGSLMGARGNSGVILSQILRGLVSVIGEAGAADGPTFAPALRAGADAAYQAVMRPVEGTILTVVREAADGAERTVETQPDADLLAVVEAARDDGVVALEKTPELLPVLAEAGVVDAGGTGFLLLLDVMLHVVDGRPVPEPRVGEGAVRPDAHLVQHTGDEGHDNVSDLRYEVMYFLEAPDEAIPAFKDVWAGIGDSIVVVGGDGIWNCHIHTDDIGAAVEAALDCGRPRNIRVTDLMEQVEEERWVRAAPPEPEPDL